jgi:hypothetical protein
VKALARLLRRLARVLDPPPERFDDWEDEYECWGDEGKSGPSSPPHVCTSTCTPLCHITKAEILKCVEQVDRMLSTDAAALFGDKATLVTGRVPRWPEFYKADKS